MPRDRLPRIMKHYSSIGRRNRGRPLKRLLDMWDWNRSTSGLTPWQTYDDHDDDAKRRSVVSVSHTHTHTHTHTGHCTAGWRNWHPLCETHIWSRWRNDEKKFLPHQSVNLCYPNFSGKKCILIYFNLSNIRVGKGQR